MNVALFTINPNFIGAIRSELQKYHDVREYIHTSNESFNLLNIHTLMRWADVAFFDFCQYPLTVATYFVDKPCKIVARLMGLEIYRTNSIIWKKVDHLILLPSHKYRQIPDVKSHSFLPVGTDIRTFKPPIVKSFQKNICIVGNVLPRKRVYTTIQTLYPLLKRGWTLHIRDGQGNFRAELRQEYKAFIKELISTLQLEDQVHWHKWTSLPEYVKFLQSMDIIISNSMMEGYHKAIFDAMSCGVVPFVNCWLGATDLFPRKFIFYTQESLKRKILKWEKQSYNEKLALSNEVREFVKQFHDERKVAKQIRKIIEEVTC
ncbi:MAG: hypothetical protein DRN81_02730 [Thermoproteota archaeon]|nr:MAG: hypothetical protein DRN81_02730 [Candidatus Korarchaeota archaeon]